MASQELRPPGAATWAFSNALCERPAERQERRFGESRMARRRINSEIADFFLAVREAISSILAVAPTHSPRGRGLQEADII
ncbi:MAG: hypothetical protein ACREP1_03035, partial [Rhodanobacteraceae bacterium]